MKKLLTLFVTLFTALSAYATDLTFNVAFEGNTVTVTPSADDQLYLCVPLDVEEVALISETVGIELNINTPQALFSIAALLHQDNLFTGATALSCPVGSYYLVMAGAEKNEEGKILATTPVTVEAFTIAGSTPDDDDPVLEPLTFTFECTTDGFTIIPSDTIQEYFAVPYPVQIIEQLQSVNMTLEDYMQYLAAYGQCFGMTNTGVSYHTLDEYLEEGEDYGDGLYTVAVMGVKADGNHHIITTPVYLFDWLIDHTTGIRNIEAAAVGSKIFKDGKFIIQGRVSLDGTLVK